MKLQSSELTFYTYLKTGPKEDYEACVRSFIAEMHRAGFRYDPREHGDCRREPQDYYSNGVAGAPLFFRGLKKKHPARRGR